jgi:hypothetical protein
MNSVSKLSANLGCFFNKKLLALAFSLLMVMLISVSFVSAINEASVMPDVVVDNETELLNAIEIAPNKTAYVIGISGDIVLQNSLEIPKGKNIVLVVSDSSFILLVGGDGMDTIIVKNGGTLTLKDGVTVTHVNGTIGRGVYVESKGTFILSGGNLSGNTINDNGGGVYNAGTFTMVSGIISNNIASNWGGRCVYG